MSSVNNLLKNLDVDSLSRTAKVVHTVNPGEFYIRLTDESPEFERLEKAMADFYNSFEGSCNNFEMVKDVEEYLQASNERWLVIKFSSSYRRAILKEFRASNIQVQFMDHYTVYEASRKNCFLPKDQFFQDPPFLTRCNIANVAPNGEDDQWSQEAIDFFNNKLSQQLAINLLLRHHHKEVLSFEDRRSLPVEICFREMFAERALCQTVYIVRYMSELLIKEGFGRLLQAIVAEDQDEDQADDVQDNCDDCQEEDIFLAPEVVQRWPDPAFPAQWKLGETRRIRVTQIDPSGQIYANFRGDGFMLESMEDTFSSVYGCNIEDAFFADRTMKTMWRKNEDCVVFHPESKTWNRARITKIFQPSGLDSLRSGVTYSVYLVDHGVELGGRQSSLKVTASYLRIPFHFGDVPIRSNRFVVEGIVPLITDDKSYNWPIEVITFMFQKTYLDIDIGKAVYAQKTRDVTRFPIPVQVRVKVPNSVFQQFDLADAIMRHYSNLMCHDWPNLVDNASIFSRHAHNIEAVRPTLMYWEVQSDEPEVSCPYLPPELTESLFDGALLPVKISFICADGFRISFDDKKFEEIIETLQKESPTEPPVQLTIGVKVSCMVSGTWYRGYIQKLHEKDDIPVASVYMTDYCYLEPDVPVTNIRNLPESVCDIPMLSWVCQYSREISKEMYNIISSPDEKLCFALHEQIDSYTVVGQLYVDDSANPASKLSWPWHEQFQKLEDFAERKVTVDNLSDIE